MLPEKSLENQFDSGLIKMPVKARVGVPSMVTAFADMALIRRQRTCKEKDWAWPSCAGSRKDHK